MDAENLIKAECQFGNTCDDWMTQYKGLGNSAHPWLPDTWRKGLTLPPIPTGADAVNECSALEKLKAERTAARRQEITAQAWGGTDAVAPVWAVLGDPMRPFKLASVKLRTSILEYLTGPIFFIKEQVNRGRPACCCTTCDLDPMFPNGPLHPGHPSYPSGHATQAHAMALVLAQIKPALAVKFKDAAKRVAENREVAGLHFASDSAAGEALASHLVKLLGSQKKFKKMLAEASADWP